MSTQATPTALIVEDDPSQLSDYTSELKKLGYVVYGAASAEDGLKTAQSTHIDVILTDNVLPSMTGLRSISEYAKHTQAPVFVMTSHYSSEIEKDASLLGAYCCLKKPLDFVLLGKKLAAAVTNGAAQRTS